MTDQPAGERDETVQETEGSSEASASAARLFDIRRLIGGLFVVYGVLVTVAGLVDGDTARKKAAGIDINLWAGLAMLVFGLLMLLWQALRPATTPPSGAADGGAADQQARHS